MRNLHAGHFPQFQFHYGTIKSLGELVSAGRNALFQFHYGTIKRWKLP